MLPMGLLYSFFIICPRSILCLFSIFNIICVLKPWNIKWQDWKNKAIVIAICVCQNIGRHNKKSRYDWVRTTVKILNWNVNKYLNPMLSRSLTHNRFFVTSSVFYCNIYRMLITNAVVFHLASCLSTRRSHTNYITNSSHDKQTTILRSNILS